MVMSGEHKTLVVLGTTAVCGLAVYLAYRYFCSRRRPTKRAVVKSLYIYPVKSCDGIKLDQIEITKISVLLDRSWALFNSKGVLQTMRQFPKMALIRPSFEGTKYLCLDAPGMTTLKLDVDVNESEVEKRTIELFGLLGEGLDCGDEAGRWFDEYLGKQGNRLFNGHSDCLKRRELKEDKIWGSSVQPDDKMIYPDTAPVMLVSELSLEAVNKELEDPVDIRTFRPNIFIEGCSAFEEDTWESLQIGNVLLRKLRQDPRCVLITVDMDAGVKRKDGEPLKTLKRIRVSKNDDARHEQKPLFGVYFIADIPGTINVGDDVIVLA